MKKFKFFIDYDKEEKWLFEMANKGYELVNVSFGYKFRSTEPKKDIIRIDYRTFKKRKDFIDYCTLFEDSGWQHIAGGMYSGTQYFRRIEENSGDDIFSDAVSRAGKYKRLSAMWMMLAVCYLPILTALFLTGAIDGHALFNLKLLYYTPGLWEMTGADFWRHFWFETPFVVFRGLLWLVFPISIVTYLCFFIKAKTLYNKNIQVNP